MREELWRRRQNRLAIFLSEVKSYLFVKGRKARKVFVAVKFILLIFLGGKKKILLYSSSSCEFSVRSSAFCQYSNCLFFHKCNFTFGNQQNSAMLGLAVLELTFFQSRSDRNCTDKHQCLSCCWSVLTYCQGLCLSLLPWWVDWGWAGDTSEAADLDWPEIPQIIKCHTWQ